MTTISDRLVMINLSAEEFKSYGFSDDLINYMINIQNNQDTLGNNADTSAEQVSQNTQDIQTNRDAINTNTTNIGVNAGNISDNTQAIVDTNTALSDHTNSNSQHGVTGDNVGTENYAQNTVGGVVFIMTLVADAIDSTAEVTSPDATAAPAAYDQAHIEGIVTLANEIKEDHNQLVTDLNNSIAQLNELLTNSKTSRQMSSA